MMFSKETLINKLSDLNLDYYETISCIDEDSSIQLLDFKDLFVFINKHNIDTVFFHFDYASAEELEINDSVLEGLHLDEEILNVMQKDFVRYNRTVHNLDFCRPYALEVYCIYQNKIVYAEEYNFWFRDMGFDLPKKVAVSMIEEKLEEIERKKEDAFSKREQQREQLREEILADENFHRCTNKEFRREYTRKLWNNKAIQKLFYSPKHGYYDIRIDTFIENVWREYKSSL